MVIEERATELGRLVGQSEEYQAWKRANDRLLQEAELKSGLERLRDLQIMLSEQMNHGQAPSPEQQAEVDQLVGKLQGHPVYQGMVAAQANLDKLMRKIDEWMMDGIRKGAESRIITLG